MYRQANQRPYVDNTNCYAYAMDTLVRRSPQEQQVNKLQPGYNQGLMPLGDGQYRCDELTRRVLQDYPDTILMDDWHTACPQGYHDVFLAIDDNGAMQDYHFLRGDQGRVSHKRGSDPVTYVDAEGRAMTNIMSADLDYDLADDGVHNESDYDYRLCRRFCVPDRTPTVIDGYDSERPLAGMVDNSWHGISQQTSGPDYWTQGSSNGNTSRSFRKRWLFGQG